MKGFFKKSFEYYYNIYHIYLIYYIYFVILVKKRTVPNSSLSFRSEWTLRFQGQILWGLLSFLNDGVSEIPVCKESW